MKHSIIAITTFISLSSSVLAGPRDGHTTFHNTSDRRIHVSVLYHACTLKSDRIKPNVSWTAKKPGCCVKRIDLRDADTNTFFVWATEDFGNKFIPNASELHIAIDNVSKAKLAEAAGAITGITVGAVGAIATFYVAGVGFVLGFPAAMAAQASVKPNINAWIECSENSS